MTPEEPAEFRIEALYAALDAKRQARGISWQQVAREVSAQLTRLAARPISPSTIAGTRSARVVEGDGVLQMLLWLDRTPESFLPGHKETSTEDARLPRVDPHKILRFDAAAIYAALDAQRTERGMTWKQVAHEIGGLNATSLTRLAKGGRVGFPSVMRIVRWLGHSAASFTRASDW